MAENTKIQWCDHTFNPWEGCAKVSPGCTNCYAEARNNRFGGGNWGKGRPRRRTSAANWRQPIKWNLKPWICPQCGHAMSEDESKNYRSCPTGTHFVQHHRARVFCASLADWLDDEVPVEWLADLLKLIYETPNLDWLLLTKRPENFERLREIDISGASEFGDWLVNWSAGFTPPPANVWFGVSVEDQQRANERIPELLKIPAKVRFLSVEPMLGPIDLRLNGDVTRQVFPKDFANWSQRQRDEWINGTARATYISRLNNVDWAIFGGESGKGARPCNVEWIRDGVRQCRAAGVATFVKQLGSKPIGKYFPNKDWSKERDLHESGMIRESKGGDMSEWPEDLRVREFPQ